MTQTTLRPTSPAISDAPARPSVSARPRLAADWLALAGFGLLTLLFFWPLLFEPGTYVPKGGGDLASFLYPVHVYSARSLQAGILPLWNPHLYAGSPFMADMQTGIFYPLNLITFLSARPFTYQALEALAVVHHFLAGVFAYTYLRVMRLDPLAAFAGGIVFAFSGFLVAHLGHLNMIEAAVWLPLILATFHLARRRRSYRWAALSGLIFGVAILPGHVQISLYTGFFLLLYWLWGTLSGRSQVPSPKEGSPPTPFGLGTWDLGLLATTIGFAAGMAAIQILPSFELTRLSVRSAITFEKAIEYAASPRLLITWLAPHFFGSDAARFWGIRGNLTEVYAYAGVTTLSVAGLALIGRRRGIGWAGFFALAVVLFGLLSVAEHTPLYGWLYRFFPGFDKVRAAGRFTLFVDLSLAVLSAYGVQMLLRPLPAWVRPAYDRYLRLLGWLTLALLPVSGLIYHAMLTNQRDTGVFERSVLASESVNLGVALLALSVGLLALQRYRRPPGRVLPGLVVALLVVDLFGANLRYNPTSENILSDYQRDDALEFLRQAPGQPFRIDTETGIGEVWPPNASLLFGLHDVLGIFNPMQLADHQRYWASLGSRSTASYDLLNARYVITFPDAPLDTAKFRPVKGAGPLVIHENTRALPRAFLVPDAEVLSRDAILERLRSPDFDPRAMVLLEARGTDPTASAAGAVGGGRARDAAAEAVVQVTSDPNELVVSTSGDEPAYLFVSEVFYPGWQATVDGRPTEILRANFLFRAVALPAGSHEVRF
ncbi:MAG TPA: YfhO family protein, partial [Dehalococcoidia bacterium]|nr:YfhO family protein [Dehalococcoidia bacterium]